MGSRTRRRGAAADSEADGSRRDRARLRDSRELRSARDPADSISAKDATQRARALAPRAARAAGNALTLPAFRSI